MEIGAEPLIGWSVSAILTAAAFYLLLWPRSVTADRGPYRQKPSNSQGSPGLSYKPVDGAPSKSRFGINFNINFNIATLPVILLFCAAINFPPLNSWLAEKIDQNDRQEFAPDKGGKYGSDPVSLTRPLLTGLDYELANRPHLALAAYREAYEDSSLTLEARAFLLSRIAAIRFAQGFTREAHQDARHAVDLAGPKTLYIHTLAKILIDQCELDDARGQLRRIRGDNVISRELLTAIDGSRVTCLNG